MTSQSCERSSRVINADVQSRFIDSWCSPPVKAASDPQSVAGCCHLMRREFEHARCKMLIIQSAKGQTRRKRGALDEVVLKQAVRWSVCVYCSLSSTPAAARGLFSFFSFSLSLSLALPVIKSRCHWSPATAPGSGFLPQVGGAEREKKEERVWERREKRKRDNQAGEEAGSVRGRICLNIRATTGSGRVTATVTAQLPPPALHALYLWPWSTEVQPGVLCLCPRPRRSLAQLGPGPVKVSSMCAWRESASWSCGCRKPRGAW